MWALEVWWRPLGPAGIQGETTSQLEETRDGQAETLMTTVGRASQEAGEGP